MELKEFQTNYIFTTKIEIDDENYIELREPTILELKEFNEDVANNINVLTKIFPDCIIKHTFTKDGKQASNKEVAEMLKKSGSMFSEIINIWMQSVPFQNRVKKK